MTASPPSRYAVRLASATDRAQVARCRFEWALERRGDADAAADAG
ncbi:MAG: hypothetical protein V9F04_13590 [Dermatophilaceae bacterium]